MKTVKTSFGTLNPMVMLFLFLLFTTACSKQELEEPNVDQHGISVRPLDKTKTFYGPAKPLGQGVARTWVVVDASGKPISLGVNISAKAVDNLDTVMFEHTLQLPQQVAVPPYDHMDLGWNPKGHEPQGVYTLPHFDIHLYMISQALKSTIPGMNPPYFDPAPDAKYIPEDYMQGPGLVPNMGAHWVDLQAPEFQPGGKFSRTFIYGSYSGNIIFIEPMFTLEYLQHITSETISIRLPSAFQKAGYYPSSYTISYRSIPNEYVISFDNLQYYPAE